MNSFKLKRGRVSPIGKADWWKNKWKRGLHVVDSSPWPLVVSCGITGLAITYLSLVHSGPYTGVLALVSLLVVILG